MKPVFLLFIPICFFISCSNNNDTETAADNSPVPSQEKNLREAIDSNPDSLKLRENLIQYLSDNENYEKALAETDKAIIKDSNNLPFWRMKAQLHFALKDTIKSIKAYEKVLELFPEPGDMMDLGSLYAATKNPMALEIADALIIGKKANAEKEALFLKGLYYNYTGDKSKAIAYFDQCLNMDFTFMFAYREKAIALYDQGKYTEALAVLNKATTLQNGFDEGYYWAGRCYEKLNKQGDAIENYQLAIQVAERNQDDNVEAREALTRLGIK